MTEAEDESKTCGSTLEMHGTWTQVTLYERWLESVDECWRVNLHLMIGVERI